MISKDNHAEFTRLVLLAVRVKKHKHEFFCDIQNNQGLGKASADNPYLDLDYSGYHKNRI